MRFDHVGLNVASLDEMRDWYAGALGLEVEYEFALEEFAFSGAMLLSPEGWRLELLHRVGNVAGIVVDRPMDAAMTRGFGHLALTVDDLEATYDRLLAAGAASRMPPSQSPEPGVRIAFVADPEGNLVELLDRSSAPLVEEGRSPVSKPSDTQGSLSGDPGFVTGASAPSSTSGGAS